MITGPSNTNNPSGTAINKYTAESKAGKAVSAQAPAQSPQIESGTSAASAPSSTHVSLSKEAKMMQRLAQEISSYPSVDAERVTEIKQELANGGYKINSGAIAQKMMLLDSLY